MVCLQFSIIILGVHFGNSVFDNSNYEFTIWKTSLSGAECNSLLDEKEIVNQILLFKCWYIGQVDTIPKFIKKKIINNSSTLHLEVWSKYFRRRYPIKFPRTSMDLEIIKPNQWSRERSRAVLTELKE